MQKLKLIVLSVGLLCTIQGCSSFRTSAPRLATADAATSFAYDLGATHAGFMQCSNLSQDALDMHLLSAELALKAQVSARLAELIPVFEKGLREPPQRGSAAHISCDCASALIGESQRHNLNIYRQPEKKIAP